MKRMFRGVLLLSATSFVLGWNLSSLNPITSTATKASMHCNEQNYDKDYKQQQPEQKSQQEEVVDTSTRRSFLTDTLLAATVTSTSFLLGPTGQVLPANAATDEDEEIEVYFGCGCFWHVQHEFVQAERNILGRTDDKLLSSRAGYAGGNIGGNGGMKDGKVCYHNAASIADYGSLGHAEVVRLRIPSTSFSQFATEYFKLFNDKGDRPDQFGDRGSEYRNLVGLPGGTKSIYAKQLVEASMKTGDKLDFAKGRGNDPDARAVAFVMDTSDFPFHVAEQYHQFHDGFNFGENYPNSYNNIASKLATEGTLGTSSCPNGLLGVGVLGL